jgi:hypothetical protein
VISGPSSVATASPFGGVGILEAAGLGQEVSRYTELDYDWVLIDGAVSKSRITSAFDRLNVGADDTIFFYYVGRGLRSKIGILPYLFVGTGDTTGLDANTILDAIRKKKMAWPGRDRVLQVLTSLRLAGTQGV